MNDTAQPAQRRRPIWRRPWMWIVVLGLAAAAVAAPFVAEWTLRRTVDATLLQDTINAALAGSTDDLYYIEVGELDYTIADGDVLARNVRLRPRIDAIHERRAAGILPALLFDVVVDEVSFVGIELAMLAQERDLYAMRVSLQRPRVRIINAIDLARQAAEDAAARNSDAGQVLPQLGLGQREGEHGNETLLEHLVEGLPVIDIREVRIDNADITSEQLTEAALLAAASSSASVTEGTLDLETVNSSENVPGGGMGDLAGGALIDPIELLLAEAPATESIENISISLEDLRIDTASARDPDKILFSDNVRVEIGRYTRTNADGLYRLETGPVVLSTGRSDPFQLQPHRGHQRRLPAASGAPRDVGRQGGAHGMGNRRLQRQASSGRATGASALDAAGHRGQRQPIAENRRDRAARRQGNLLRSGNRRGAARVDHL